MKHEVNVVIGPGKAQIPGYIPIEINEGNPGYPLPFADGTVDRIYASHVLEHFPHTHTAVVLADWCRALKDGGTLQIAVPDFDKVCEEARKTFPHPHAQGWLHGGHVDQHDVHRASFTRDQLMFHLRQAGLRDIADFEPWNNDTSTHPIGMRLQGTKKVNKIPKVPHIALCMSWGRLAFSDTVERVVDIINAWAKSGKVQITRITYGGAFWETATQAAINGALKEEKPDNPFDYFMFVDHDGTFNVQDADRMLEAIQTRPELDAVYPVQVARHNDLPLVFNPDLDYSGDVTETFTGHFGLTLIRSNVFREMPKPWFICVPNEDGDYSNVGIGDADIVFWRSFKTWGFRVAQVNTVQIGHMELGVRYWTPRGPAMIPIQVYRTTGNPPNQIDWSAVKAAWHKRNPGPQLT